jgi:hypothetical protein
MQRTAIESTSDRENADDMGVNSSWYTVVHNEKRALELASVNPWNHDTAEYEQVIDLLDDCVITFRPARHTVRNHGPAIYEKGRYFLEISNQDNSTVLSSAQVFTWEEVNKLAFFFKDISFTAAARVWKSKQLS